MADLKRIVGLTGGIGCGKSTIAGKLRAMGVPVVDADRISWVLMRPGSWLERRVAAALPDSTRDGVVHRRVLGKMIFNDPPIRRWLVEEMFPHIEDAFQSIVAHLDDGIVVYDAPLFFELGLEKRYPEVIVVHVPPDVQRQRISDRDPDLSWADIEARIAVQMPLEEKVKRATWSIENSGSRADLERCVEEMWDEIVG